MLAENDKLVIEFLMCPKVLYSISSEIFFTLKSFVALCTSCKVSLRGQTHFKMGCVRADFVYKRIPTASQIGHMD